MKSINLIIPCFNEEANILPLYREMKTKLNFSYYDFTFLFIDDGSIDKTSLIISQIAVRDEKVQLIKLSRNFGKEAAIMAGLTYSKSDASIIIDADLQMPLSSIETLLRTWATGHKIVTTYRNNRSKTIKSNFATMFYKVYNWLSKNDIQKDALDFQLLDKQVREEIVKCKEYNRFFKGLSSYVGFSPINLPINMEKRVNGKSNFHGFIKLFNYGWKSIAINSTFLLKLSTFIGFLISFIGFINIFWIIYSKYVFDNAVSGWSSLMSVLIFFSGITLIVLGIIGYYIGLIYEEVKQRPIFIIDTTENIKI